MRSLVPRREDFLFPVNQYINDAFDSIFSQEFLPSLKNRSGFPRMNIVEDQTDWKIIVHVPGVNSEDLDIEIKEETDESGFKKQRIVKISGQSSDFIENKKETCYHVRELSQSKFSRCVVIPDNIQGEPEATLKKGVLTLTWKLPEKTNIEEPKKISVTEED